MSFSYSTVSIGSTAYDVYGDQDAADNYLAATITASGTAWAKASTTLKAQALVSSTRWLDQGAWLGAMTDSTTPQALQFPRTGLTLNGQAVDANSIPLIIEQACFELSAMLVADPNLRSTMLNPQVREQHAGSAGQSFFRPSSVQVLSLFPTIIQKMVLPFLGGGQAVTGAVPNDVCDKSRILDHPYNLNHGL